MAPSQRNVGFTNVLELIVVYLARNILLWAHAHLKSLRATHLPGVLNVSADRLSRASLFNQEWRVHPLIIELVWERFVDLFASRENTHCELFFSIRDKDAPVGTDALAHPWPNVLLYAFPPVHLIPHVLTRVRERGLPLVLIALWWVNRPWLAEIFQLLAEELWQLPDCRDLLSQMGGSAAAPRPDGVEFACLPRERATLGIVGLPPNVIATIQSARAPSTRSLYDLKWKAFERWCVWKGVIPFQCLLSYVLIFLRDLFEQDLAFSTIKVYLSAILACHVGYDGISPDGVRGASSRTKIFKGRPSPPTGGSINFPILGSVSGAERSL